MTEVMTPEGDYVVQGLLYLVTVLDGYLLLCMLESGMVGLVLMV